MSSRGFRERVAVALLGAALVMGAMLGVMTVRSFTQPASSAVAADQGQVSGTTQAGGGTAAMATAAARPAPVPMVPMAWTP